MQTLERNEQEILQQETVNPADYRKLIRRLKKIEGRLRLQEAVRLLPYGLLAGGSIGLIMAIWSRVTPSFTMEQVFMVAIPAVIIGVLAVLGYAYLRPRKLIKTARHADYVLGLKERISTAIEGHLNPDKAEYLTMGTRQFNDARQSLDGLKTAKAIPLRMRRRNALLALAIIPALALALFLPNPFSDQVKENQAIKAQIEQQAQKIEELKQRIISENPQAAKDDPKIQELLKQLDQVKDDLLQNSNNKDDALAALDKAQQELQKLSDPNQSTAEKAALESLAKTFNSSDATKAAGQALQQTGSDRYQNAAQELEKLANDQNALNQLKNDPNQAQQLSQALSKDAQNFKNSNPQMSDKLQQLSNAVNPNNLKQDTNSAQAQQGLKDVAQQLRQTGQSQQANDQLQQAQSQLQKSEDSINQVSQQSQQVSQDKLNKANSDNSGDSTSQDASQNQQQADQGQQGQQGQQGDQGQQGQQGDQGQQGQQGNQGQQGAQQGQQKGQQGLGQDAQGQDASNQQGQGQGQQSGDQSGDQQADGTGNQPGDNKGSKAGKGSSDAVYQDPTKRNTNGSQVNVSGKNGQGPNSSQNVNGGTPTGDASVPYSQVLEDYQQQAAQQLDKNYIPLTLKDMVKQYFDDLNNKGK